MADPRRNRARKRRARRRLERWRDARRKYAWRVIVGARLLVPVSAWEMQGRVR